MMTDKKGTRSSRHYGRRTGGKISEYDPNLGRGYIRYRLGDIAFNSKDVSNFLAEHIRKGQTVFFELEYTHRGVRAKDIEISLPPNRMYLYLPTPEDVDDDETQPTRFNNESQESDENSDFKGTSKKASIALALVAGKIRLVSLSEDGTYKFLDEQHQVHNLLYLVSSYGAQLKMAIEELEFLMNEPKAKENDFQNFFQRNPDFILNDDYKVAHPHLVLSQDEKASLIPDFILEPIDQSSLCDVLELKLPSPEVFVLKKNRARFSSAVYEAAAQLREYSRFFDEEKNRKRFQQAYPHLNAYKPRMFVIIGRKSIMSATQQRDIHIELPHLYLRTYDDVLNRMKWKMQSAESAPTTFGFRYI